MRHILITGANQGLGLSLVTEYLAKGDTVYAGIHRKSAAIRQLSQETREKLIPLLLDVTSEGSVRKMLKAVQKRTDKLDILINNAAVHLSPGEEKITEMDPVRMMRTFDVNSAGPARMIKHFLPLLERGEKKIIVNISSEAGSITNCGRESEYDYCMSKAALNMLTKLMQNFGKAKGLKVLSIHPGWMRTSMGGPTAHFPPDVTAKQIVAQLERPDFQNLPAYMNFDGTPLPW